MRIARPFKGINGNSVIDIFILFSVMAIYLAASLSLRLLMGKKTRDSLFTASQLDFATFMYKILKPLRLHKSMLLRLDSSEYGYKCYCRVNRDDIVFVMGHENELMRHFNPAAGSVVVDVGAHIGTYTLMSAMRVGKNGRVIANTTD